MLRNLAFIFCAVIFAMAPASGQSAKGKLSVQAVVQGSVALVNMDGEWKLMVANAPDPVETHGALLPAPQHHVLAKAQKVASAAAEQPVLSDRLLEFDRPFR